eukprot:COSAG05_NODE_23764_length_255_cov_467.339744_1_plen_41_part_10
MPSWPSKPASASLQHQHWPAEYLDPILLEPMVDPVRTTVGV